MMKKILLILLTFTLIFAAASCGKKDSGSEDESGSASTSHPETIEPYETPIIMRSDVSEYYDTSGANNTKSGVKQSEKTKTAATEKGTSKTTQAVSSASAGKTGAPVTSSESQRSSAKAETTTAVRTAATKKSQEKKTTSALPERTTRIAPASSESAKGETVSSRTYETPLVTKTPPVSSVRPENPGEKPSAQETPASSSAFNPGDEFETPII